MKFAVIRSSMLFDEGAPCEEAIKVTRHNGEDGWDVTLSSLEELMSFVRKHDCIIVKTTSAPDVEGIIEIYDDFRE